MWWQALIGVLTGLVLVYLVLLLLMWRSAHRNGNPVQLRESLRLVPDVMRLLRRLAGDPALPLGVRVRLALLLAYLICPIDLVPDFIPVLGYVDDAVIVAIAVRSVARHAGAEALIRHWPGTPEGLATIRRFAGY